MLNQFPTWINDQKTQKIDAATCTKCQSQWFEQVEINKYHANHSTIIGQAVPVIGGQSFRMLRCVKCATLHRPNVIITAQDTATKLYNSMLDQLDTEDTGK